MAYVYHRKHDLRGTVLLPLNALATVHPDVYATAKAKYAGRERLMEYVIPLLGVRWNDVVHCAPIHPHLVYTAWREAGGAPRSTEWFKIPVERLPAERTVWFGYRTDFSPDAGELPPDADFEAFDPARFRELEGLPAATLAAYREQLALGRLPLRFVRVPHVLVAGPIDVADLEEIEWSSPPDGVAERMMR